jgi:hypothetical protein
LSEGPTVVGSIVAKLTIDKSEWDTKLAAADAEARRLGAVDPEIKVEAKVDSALAKLAAVDAAQKKLDLSTASLQLAYQRLDEIQSKGGVSQSRLMAAHLAAQRAEMAHEAATRNLAAAQAAEVVTTDNATDATNRLNQANTGSVQRWQLIAVAIAALIPLLAPLASYAVGVGGALAGMGAAGALAIYGIVKAIKDGTVAGAQYQRGLDQLKQTLDSLGATAANRMLAAFGSAVAMINLALPELNNQIGVFSGYAGRIGTTVLQSVINALHVLNPLFVQGADYVAQLAAGFEAWTANGGLEKFTSYAMQMFPQVAATLGSLASLALHVVEGFSSWGGPVLTVLKAVADALNAIPTPVLPALALGAIGVASAFKAWSAVKGSIDGVTGSLNMTQGAAKTAFATLLQGVAAIDAAILQMSAAASSGIKQWQGLTQSNDKWSASIRAGKLDTAQLGRTLQATGGFWNDFAKNIDIAGTSVRPLYDNVKALDQALASATPHDAAIAYGQLMEAGKKAGKSAADMAALFPAATAAMHAQAQAGDEAAKAALDNASGLDAAGVSAQKTQDAMKNLNDTLKGLGSAQLDASSATIQYNQAIADSTAAVKQNGVTLDQNTQQGRDNQRALDGIASSAIQMIAANQQAGASTGDLTSQMVAARAAFIKSAEQMGLNADQAGKLADQYHLIPGDVNTAFTTSGAADAMAAAAAVKAKFDAIERLITIRVNTIMTNATNPNTTYGLGNGGINVSGKRDGGTIHAATGLTVPGAGSSGVDSVYAMLAPLEEVISNRYGQADRNRGLLKVVNSGANAQQVASYALAQAGGSKAKPAPTYVYNNTFHVAANDPSELAGKVAMLLNRFRA